MKDILRVSVGVGGFWALVVWLLGGSLAVILILTALAMVGAVFVLALVAGGAREPKVK